MILYNQLKEFQAEINIKGYRIVYRISKDRITLKQLEDLYNEWKK